MSAADDDTWDSKDTEEGRFRAHGRVVGHADGRILHGVAEGPFNVEGMQATMNLRDAAVAHAAGGGRWAILIEWKISMLVPPEVLELFEERTRAAFSGKAPRPGAIAWVVTPEVEGAKFLCRHFEQLYQSLGVPFRIFDEVAEARSWIDTVLDAAPTAPLD